MNSSTNFDSSIWKILFDMKRHLLAVEVRNKEEKKVSYYLVQLPSGKTYPILISHTWWAGLLDFYDGILLLHGYENEGLPIHKGIFAYDAMNGHLLWKEEEASLKQSFVEGILTQEGQSIGWKDGGLLDRPSQTFTPLEEIKSGGRHFPSLYLAGSRLFEEWRTPIEDFLKSPIIAQLALLDLYGHTYLQTYSGNLGKSLTGHWLSYSSQHKEFSVIDQVPLKALLLDAFHVEEPLLFYMPSSNSIAWQHL